MVASILTDPGELSRFAEMLRPDRFENGLEPEERVVYCGISWERYLALDKALGDDRPGPRFYYLDGELEIMTTSNEHERVKKWFGDLNADHFMEIGIDVVPRGQATMRLALKQAGAEPDESWCLGEEKEFPDIVLEIALTSGGIKKLEVYRRFKVPEVWIWRHHKLEIFTLAKSGAYRPARKSQLLPRLDIPLLERCIAIRSWREARQTFRDTISKR